MTFWGFRQLSSGIRPNLIEDWPAEEVERFKDENSRQHAFLNASICKDFSNLQH